MADSNDNSTNTNTENTETTKIEITENNINNESIKQNTPPKPKSKHYHNLTSGARRRILDEYDRGIENPNYEVIICTNGKRQLRKRKTPLQTTHNPSPQQQSQQPPLQQSFAPPESQPPSPQHHVSWVDSIQYYNVQNTFNEQVLKQIEDLQSRISHQNDKHKKLKSKYRKLKHSLYEDEEEAEDSINNQNDNSTPDPSTQQYQQPQPEDPQQQYQQLPLKRNMRDAVDFSRYGFRMY